jgi:hypothetical protein
LRTIAAEIVLKSVYDLVGIDADNAHTDDFQLIRRALSRRLADAYDHWFWGDLIRIEKRYFRDLYTAGTSYAAPSTTAAAEIYWPQSQRYYQALLAQPLAVTSITRSSQTATVTTTSTNKLVTGDQVTISGAVETEYNITATITVTSGTTFTYTVAGSPATPATGTPVVNPNPTNASNVVTAAYWAESLNAYSGSNYSASTAYLKGDTAYYPPTDRFYRCHTDSTGNLPTDTTYWSILTEFDRYIAWAQTGKTDLTGATVLGVYTLSPRLSTTGRDLTFTLSSAGIQVPEPASICFVEYRQKPPQLYGDLFSTSAVYTANSDQIYYSSATTDGNFYDCIVTTTAGQDPDDTAASWSVVNIPADFERYLVHGAAADWWLHEKEWEQANREEAAAMDALSDQSSRLINQSGQRTRTQVLTR